MRSWATLFIVNIFYGGVVSDNKYDFGLIENEPLLRDLHSEDLLLSSTLEEANKYLDSEDISNFLWLPGPLQGSTHDASLEDFMSRVMFQFKYRTLLQHLRPRNDILVGGALQGPHEQVDRL